MEGRKIVPEIALRQDFYPLRLTCVWPSDHTGPTQSQWLDMVSRLPGLPAQPLDVFESKFASLTHLSVLYELPHEADRAQRAQLARWLENMASKWQLAIAVTGGVVALRGPRLVVLDADSTLFRGEVIELVARHAGTEKEVAAITSAAMRGELDFSASLRRRMATLRDLPVSVLEEVAAGVQFSAGAYDMVQAFHRQGVKVGVVSGGFMEIVQPLAQQIGLDYMMANRFEIADNRLTGRASGLIVTGQIKELCVRQWADDIDCSLDEVVAVGDGANDVAMVQTAGIGIAYCAHPILNRHADARIPFPNLAAAADLTGPTASAPLA